MITLNQERTVTLAEQIDVGSNLAADVITQGHLGKSLGNPTVSQCPAGENLFLPHQPTDLLKQGGKLSFLLFLQQIELGTGSLPFGTDNIVLGCDRDGKAHQGGGDIQLLERSAH